LARKQRQQGRGRISTLNKGNGVSHDKAHKSKDETEKLHSHSKKRRKLLRKIGWWKKFF
jgi:hypothetical protein